MNIKKIEKLDDEINQKSFEKTNKGKYYNWYWLSIFIQILNIIVSVFGIYILLNTVLDDFIFKQYIIAFISVAILFFWENLKRSQIRTTTISYLKNKFNNIPKLLPTSILTLFIIIISSCIAIKGGIELSDKQQHVEVVTDNKINVHVDSINKIYNNDISKIEVRLQFIYDNAKNRKGESRALNDIELIETKNLDTKINELKIEKQTKISLIENKINIKKDKENFVNSNNVTIFVVSSLIFELLIIIGVSFCTTYDFFSFNEIYNGDSYKKYNIYLNYLNIFYQNGESQTDDRCLSESRFTDIIKLKSKSLSNGNSNNVKDFITTLYYLKIIELRTDKRRYYIMDFTEAKNKLENYLKQ